LLLNANLCLTGFFLIFTWFRKIFILLARSLSESQPALSCRFKLPADSPSLPENHFLLQRLSGAKNPLSEPVR
jgi:hypothetical protein